MPDESHIGPIEALHAGPHRLVIAITGGGSRIISDLLQLPGASNTVLEAIVPYSSQSMSEWLGREPEGFCSRSTALRMSAVAWHRARTLARAAKLDDDDCFGVACTASLASSRPKRGEHRVWIAIEGSAGTWLRSVTLAKDKRNRSAEESIVTDTILSAICAATIGTELQVTGLTPEDSVVAEETVLPEVIRAVRKGTLPVAWSLPGGVLSSSIAADERPTGLLSGSFDPLHDGHRELRHIAEEQLGGSVGFELPVSNADKPPLDAASIESCRRQFDQAVLALSAAPLFVDKAGIFPNSTFVIGYDTAERVIQPRFYGGSESAMHESFQQIRDAGCRFLVAGRLSSGGFSTLEQLSIPAGLRDLFDAIPESRFRLDISSTELRQSAAD